MKDLDKLWLGLVEENKDPDRLGRIKVRVQSVFDEIPLEDIPWANPIKTLSSRSYEIPAIGKIVSVFFPNDNLYEPYYMFSDHYNVNLKKKLSDLSEDEYVNFVAVVFDHKTKVYSDDTNLTMDYLYNKITIDNDNINLELKDNNRKVNIGTKDATQQAVLGNHFFDWFDKFMDKLVQPSSLMGNMGAPILKPEIDGLIVEYKTLRETFVSDHVYIVDDKKVSKLETEYNSPIMDDGVNINNESIFNTDSIKEGIGQDVVDKIREQKNKELEKLKNSLPSDAIEQYATADDPESFDNDYTEYKEINNSKEILITKERYDEIKSQELFDSGLEVYYEVDIQDDADSISYQIEYDEIDYDIIGNNENIYISQDNAIYTDMSEISDTPKLNTKDNNINNKGVSINCKEINQLTWSYNMKLSDNFTLASLSNKTYYKYNIPDNKKVGNSMYTKYDIACNLKALAINVLEPIFKECKKRGYGFFITNAFRNKINSTSQHEIGQAADLQFLNLNKKNYIIMANWIKNNVPYDQLLFEHRKPHSVWIHVSYNMKGNRTIDSPYPKYATFLNDKTYKRLQIVSVADGQGGFKYA